MGYFSQKNLKIQDEYKDLSYPDAKDQLLWRYKGLKDRYLELFDTNTPYSGDIHFTADDYRYAPIQYFRTPWEIHCAIEIVKDDLEAKYNIVVNDDGSIETLDEDTPDPNQITMFEIIWMPLRVPYTIAA